MMRGIARALVAALTTAAAVVAFSSAAHGAANTYYVDAISGSDANAGTSPVNAWKTLAKVNATAFAPGDRILFHRGDTWAGQLAPKGSGSAGNDIVLSSYGTGALPKIDGSALTGGGSCSGASVIYFNNQQHWTVDGFEIVNDDGTDNTGTTAVGGVHRTGICFTNGLNNGTLSGFTVVNNFIHDVNSCFQCTGYDGHMNGGIVFGANDPIGNSNFDDVYIADNTISNVDREGITVADWSTPFGYQHYYVDPSYLSTRVTIRHNAIDHVGGDGIVIKGTLGALVEHNTVDVAALKTVADSTTPSSAGIWCSYAYDTVFQYNEVSGVKTQVTDGQAFDIDGGSVNTKVQYNYTHDNEGGFILLMGLGIGETPSPSTNAIVRYNLSVNDAFPGVKGVFQFSYGVPDKLEIQNNTVYVPAGSPANVMQCDGCTGNSPGDWRFRNNIVENHGTGNYFPINAAGAIYDHNLYFGNHPSGEPVEPGKLTADPKLTNPSGALASDYQLQATSPAIGAGAVITNNGGVDYFGNALSATAPPSLGFHEGGGFAGPATLIDDAHDFLAIARHSPNVTVDTSSAANFAGDTGRLARSDLIPLTVRATCDFLKPYSITPQLTDPVYGACHDAAQPAMLPAPVTGTADGVLGLGPGDVTWLVPAMQGFSARVYVNSSTLSGISFYASPDGRTFSPVVISATPPAATAGGWFATTVTPASALPSGTNYLLARLGPDPSWATQIGRIAINR